MTTPRDAGFGTLAFGVLAALGLGIATRRELIVDGDWLKDMITKGDIKIGHENVEDGILLTAPTADLQTLVKKYADNKKAFSSPTYLVRKK